ncbi:uncharacterized protein LOC126835990 [Adelges cooleyi]|uniref:uncharacterized protein LOC126835990 n=1 Tax=Adelges cooleyi TaxID=133065 RepID=UPI00217FAB02|nr:uncharacterized protein LOC126835990 [Adelges cooleyi]
MKIFCFLTSLAFVNVSAYNMTAYKMEVFLTNAHIELAYGMNNCIVENMYITNGLEHVIKTIVYENRYYFGMMNNMIAVPEYLYQDAINVSMEIQRTMQREIEMQLKINVPEIPDEITFADFEKLNLTQLGEERRRFTGQALKSLMSQALDIDNLANLLEQRKLSSTASSKNRITRVVDRFVFDASSISMCRFIAMFMSIKFPTSYIKSLIAASDNTCIIGDGITGDKIYREIEGEWWQVEGVNDNDNKVQLLKKQLL